VVDLVPAVYYRRGLDISMKLPNGMELALFVFASFAFDLIFITICVLVFYLQVSKPRALVTIKAAVSWRLLLDEPQWVGIVLNPIDYSLKGAQVIVFAGRNLEIDLDQETQWESFDIVDKSGSLSDSKTEVGSTAAGEQMSPSPVIASGPGTEVVTIKEGRVHIPDWASNIASVLWLRATARQKEERTATQNLRLLPGSPKSPRSPVSPSRGVLGETESLKSPKSPVSPMRGLIRGADSAGNIFKDAVSPQMSPRRDSSGAGSPEEFRTLNIKLEFGAGRSRVLERYRQLDLATVHLLYIYFCHCSSISCKMRWQYVMQSDLY
jgi:hypothetical protein